MSSATPRRGRFLTRLRLLLGALLRGLLWTVLAGVLALGGAGLAGELWHPPGGPGRAELTWPGDTALGGALDAAEPGVLDVAAEVDGLAEEARIALASMTAGDPALLQESLSRGSVQAAQIDASVAALRQTLSGLPGDEPDAVLHFRNDVVVRRAALVAAVEAAGGLADQWTAVRSRSSAIADLIALIELHDTTVLDAAAEGRNRRYGRAIDVLAEARDILTRIQELRVALVAGGEATVLDEWLGRNLTYDLALTALYESLRESGGENTVEVQSAAREERIAREQLPADRRAIIVIVAEVARGGLNQAVLAIEETRGRIDAALAIGTPAEPAPGETAPGEPAAGASDTPAGGG